MKDWNAVHSEPRIMNSLSADALHFSYQANARVPKACVTVFSYGSGHGKKRIFIDLTHPPRLLGPVVSIVLYNAERVNPHVPDTELASQVYEILEEFRYSCPRDAGQVISEVSARRFKRLLSSPTVTQAKVSTLTLIAINKPDCKIILANIDYP